MKTEVLSAGVEIVCTWLHNDFLRCQPATVDNEGNIRILFHMMMLGSRWWDVDTGILNFVAELGVETDSVESGGVGHEFFQCR